MNDDSLLSAYRRTSFCADTTQGRLVIRIGRTCLELDALLLSTGSATWAYVTAFNPGSVPLTDDENNARQRQLEDIVRELGYPMFGGEGIADEGVWPPEKSVLVLGIAREAAVELGGRFGQRAIVFGHVGGPASLVELT
jgi:hypothetical protein